MSLPRDWSTARSADAAPVPMRYFARPSCFMNSWLSQNSHSWSIVPFFQCAMVAIGSANRFPVGSMNFPPPIGMGLVKVPVITPVTDVQSPDPKRIGCTLIAMSGA